MEKGKPKVVLYDLVRGGDAENIVNVLRGERFNVKSVTPDIDERPITQLPLQDIATIVSHGPDVVLADPSFYQKGGSTVDREFMQRLIEASRQYEFGLLFFMRGASELPGNTLGIVEKSDHRAVVEIVESYCGWSVPTE